MPVVSVSPIEASIPMLYIHTDLLEQFGIEDGAVITLRAGSSVTEVKITTSLNGNFVSASVLEILGLPKETSILLTKSSDKMLQIGPLIGILIAREKNRKIPPYASQNKLLQKFLGYCSANKYIGFVFCPEDVDINEKKVRGLYLATNSDGTVFWKNHVFPVPDVVYDRILHRSFERKPATKAAKSFFMNQPSVVYFNPKFLDKWQTHSILSQDPFLMRHLPTTVDYDSPEKLAELLKSYKTIYAKPIHGSLGQGIFRISVTPEGYRSQHRKGKNTYTHTFGTVEELGTALDTFKKQRSYVIQQGLDLLKYQEKVFDIRVLVQKNKYGQWNFTAMVARVARKGSIFPNIAAGGEAVNIETLWQDLYSKSWSSSETCRLTQEVSIAAAQTLEQALGTFCEIGLDIGIDFEGNIWIIEINSKPSRKVFPKDQIALKKLSLKMPMEYAAYMAGFSYGREMNCIDS